MTDYHTIMQTEVKADVYGGPNCDEVSTYFNTYCDGDMQDDDHTDDIIIQVKDLPPGAKITVEYPCCPSCGIPRGDVLELKPGGVREIVGHENMCECGFDWKIWVEEQYS